MQATVPGEVLLRQPAVLARIGLSKSTLWELVRRGDFPKPLRISPRAVAWKSSEIDRWIEGRAAAAKGGAR
jgi:prophage regulatory protein